MSCAVPSTAAPISAHTTAVGFLVAVFCTVRFSAGEATCVVEFSLLRDVGGAVVVVTSSPLLRARSFS